MHTSETQAAAKLVEKECPCLGLLVQAAKHPSAFAFAKIRDVFLEWLNMCPEAGAPFFDLMWGTSQSPVGMAGTGSPWRLFPVSRIELCVSRRFATQLMTYSPEFHSITYKYTNTLAVNTPRTTFFFFFGSSIKHICLKIMAAGQRDNVCLALDYHRTCVCPRSGALCALGRMDMKLEKHIPAKLFWTSWPWRNLWNLPKQVSLSSCILFSTPI